MTDAIKIPPPTDEQLEGILAHPDTKMRWMGRTIIITNPNFQPMAGRFRFVSMDGGDDI